MMNNVSVHVLIAHKIFLYNTKKMINATMPMNTARFLKELSFMTAFFSKGSIANLLLYPFKTIHRTLCQKPQVFEHAQKCRAFLTSLDEQEVVYKDSCDADNIIEIKLSFC